MPNFEGKIMVSITLVKLSFLLAFVMFIPVSAACYYASRTDQRESEIKRYIKILQIKEEDADLFIQKNTGLSLSIAVFFVTFLTACFWFLVMFGNDIKVTGGNDFLFGNAALVQPDDSDGSTFITSPNGAMLTFNMAFLGAYLWGIQNVTRRYSMNDLIPITYYYLGVRMIVASILALVVFYLSEAVPGIFGSTLTSASADGETAQANGSSTHLIFPVFAFLIGMFPQRGLNWLTDKFSVFTQKTDPSVRDLPLDMIEGVTIYDRVRLQETGVDGCYDLANVDYIPYLFKTPYSPRVLISWILQAKMCVYFGQHVRELREHGIHTLWQINNYEMDELKELVKTSSLTEDTLILVKNLISKDHEIERLVAAQIKLSQYWSVSEEDVREIAL